MCISPRPEAHYQIEKSLQTSHADDIIASSSYFTKEFLTDSDHFIKEFLMKSGYYFIKGNSLLKEAAYKGIIYWKKLLYKKNSFSNEALFNKGIPYYKKLLYTRNSLWKEATLYRNSFLIKDTTLLKKLLFKRSCV